MGAETIEPSDEVAHGCCWLILVVVLVRRLGHDLNELLISAVSRVARWSLILALRVYSDNGLTELQ